MAPAHEPRAWCLFRSGSEPLAVALEAVAEVVEARRSVRLPARPPRVLGLCTVRREVVPIVDLTGRSGPAGDRRDAAPVVLILRTRQGTWGLPIDRAGTVVAEATLDPLPDSPTSCGAALLGSIRRGETTYTAIDPEQTWRDLRDAIESWYRDSHLQGAISG